MLCNPSSGLSGLVPIHWTAWQSLLGGIHDYGHAAACSSALTRVCPDWHDLDHGNSLCDRAGRYSATLIGGRFKPTIPRWLLKLCPMIAEDDVSGNVETSFWPHGRGFGKQTATKRQVGPDFSLSEHTPPSVISEAAPSFRLILGERWTPIVGQVGGVC